MHLRWIHPLHVDPIATAVPQPEELEPKVLAKILGLVAKRLEGGEIDGAGLARDGQAEDVGSELRPGHRELRRGAEAPAGGKLGVGRREVTKHGVQQGHERPLGATLETRHVGGCLQAAETRRSIRDQEERPGLAGQRSESRDPPVAVDALGAVQYPARIGGNPVVQVGHGLAVALQRDQEAGQPHRLVVGSRSSPDSSMTLT